jgi:hypothetical protein
MIRIKKPVVVVAALVVWIAGERWLRSKMRQLALPLPYRLSSREDLLSEVHCIEATRSLKAISLCKILEHFAYKKMVQSDDAGEFVRY